MEGIISIDDQNIINCTQQFSLHENIGCCSSRHCSYLIKVFFLILNMLIIILALEDVIKAATLANIHHFIDCLPEKYNTVVGERGLKLSGGEKQRIAIARAVLKKPKIILFDEATSSLDSKSESEILSSMNAISKNITSLVIAHRLSTIKNAASIFMF